MLVMWTIYKNPRDFPSVYVARPFDVATGKPTDNFNVIVSPTLKALQNYLKGLNLYQLDRHPDDDPVIVETWV